MKHYDVYIGASRTNKNWSLEIEKALKENGISFYNANNILFNDFDAEDQINYNAIQEDNSDIILFGLIDTDTYKNIVYELSHAYTLKKVVIYIGLKEEITPCIKMFCTHIAKDLDEAVDYIKKYVFN